MPAAGSERCVEVERHGSGRGVNHERSTCMPLAHVTWLPPKVSRRPRQSPALCPKAPCKPRRTPHVSPPCAQLPVKWRLTLLDHTQALPVPLTRGHSVQPHICLTFVIQATLSMPHQQALLIASMRAQRKRKMRQKADLCPQLKVHGDVALFGPQIMQLCSASMQSRRRQKKSFDPPANGSLHPSRFQIA